MELALPVWLGCSRKCRHATRLATEADPTCATQHSGRLREQRGTWREQLQREQGGRREQLNGEKASITYDLMTL